MSGDIFIELARVGRFLANRDWCPATSSNFSCLSEDGSRIAITQSGKDKASLNAEDMMWVDFLGQAEKANVKPSAETLIHVAIYKKYQAQSVLHTHSVAATLLSMKLENVGKIELSGYEVLKGLAGNKTHELTEVLPILPNSQDMDSFSNSLGENLDQYGNIQGFLMAGHGLYAWGKSISEAQRHIETFEFLLSCEMEKQRWQS